MNLPNNFTFTLNPAMVFNYEGKIFTATVQSPGEMYLVEWQHKSTTQSSMYATRTVTDRIRDGHWIIDEDVSSESSKIDAFDRAMSIL